MGLIQFKHVGITGIAAAVPKNVVSNKNLDSIFSKKELENAIATTGIKERRFSDSKTCSSDLCFAAAEQLILDKQIDKQSIDVLIYLSQTPDYHSPATAPSLQHRLGLSKSTAAFDINLACSGYVYGLSTAFAYCSMEGVNTVLLLVGETLSKITSTKDRATGLLFGDAGTATLIEKNEKYANSYFSLNSDGSGEYILRIPAGGYRNPSNANSTQEKQFEDGSIRSDEQLFMDGMEVFNFTMNVVPKDLKILLEYAGKTNEDIDYLVFHQANKYMTDFLAKKSKIPLQKVPYSIQNFGNTSAASIPLTMVTNFKGHDLDKKVVAMSGFGAGLSWGSALLQMDNIIISQLIDL
jgi:3-oxoacyl-[acyl-carrier-protein] synthase-3